MASPKILVTGSSGTIGTRLCEKLLAENFQVIGVDRRPNQWQSRVDSITIQGDLADPAVFDRLPSKMDLIVHLAASARVHQLVERPELAFENIRTTFNVLEFARKNNIKKLIFASSREIYGNSAKITHEEKDVRLDLTQSPYSASKISGEALIHAWQNCYGLDFVILRFSNVYGMYDSSDRLVPLFMESCRKGRDLTVYGREKLLDFTYIDDAVNGILLAISRFDAVKNETFNISSGQGVKITKVARILSDALNPGLKVKYLESRAGEVVRYTANLTSARSKLGFVPRFDIQEGLKKSLEWYT